MQGRLFADLYVELDERLAPWDVSGSWQRVSNSLAQATSLEILPYFRRKLLDLKDPTFLDIGANGGAFALLTAHVPGARCIAFEPNPILAAALIHTVELNDLRNRVQVEVLALSNKEGSADLHILTTETGMSRLFHPFEHRTDMITVQVLMRPLDDLDLPKIDLIKLDVEGAELLVLQGGEKTIRRDMPGILMEWWPPHCNNFNYHPTRIDRMLEEWGYTKTQVSHTDVFYERKENDPQKNSEKMD